MRAYERLLKYVVIKTPSDDNNSECHPSSQCQFELAHLLVDEMKELGLQDVSCDEHCYVYGKLPATPGYEDKDCLGFVAHMDIVSDYTEADIHPILHENYDCEDIVLGDSGRVLSVKNFPHLTALKGETLITSDGNTVLGVDDKAGIAEILTMVERINAENIPHGPIAIAFTPDEEIGTGTACFDIEKFGAKYAYTLDGDTENEIQYESFNAYKADVEFTGFGVHPGSSKDAMINACLVAHEFNSMLPSGETPRGTEDHEGFYHLNGMSGDVTKAELHYIIRDHDSHMMDARLATLRHIEKLLNEKWGEGTVKLTTKLQYRNMADALVDCMHLVDYAKVACERAGVVPEIIPIRGGTDGCKLSFMGLPCPNLGTGGHAYHGPWEHTTIEAMDRATNVAIELVKVFAE